MDRLVLTPFVFMLAVAGCALAGYVLTEYWERRR